MQYLLAGFDPLEWGFVIMAFTAVAAVTFFATGIILNLTNRGKFKGKVYFIIGGVFALTSLILLVAGYMAVIMILGHSDSLLV